MMADAETTERTHAGMAMSASHLADAQHIGAADTLLERIGDLHSAPRVVQELLNQTRSLDFDIKALTRTLASDPALSAKILRLVNSASYGLPRKITALPQAVMILGQRTLRLVVMTFSLVDKLTKGVPQQLYTGYWKRALTMALSAQRLSRTCTELNPDEAYAAGLLADLGVLVFAQNNPERYTEIALRHPHGLRLMEAEREKFGCDHGVLGARLLEKWGFAESCQWSTIAHHQTTMTSSQLVTTIQASSLIADMLWTPGSDEVKAAQQVLREQFEYDTDELIDLALACKEEMVQQAEMYGVHLKEEIDVKALMAEARRQFVTASLETARDFDTAMAVMDDSQP